jgi:hypothetical protein
LGQKGASLRLFNHLQPRNKALLLSGLPFALLLLFVGTTASSDQPREPIIHPVENANFKSGDDPTCIATALEAGDPSAGASTVLIKANKGCFVRWHADQRRTQGGHGHDAFGHHRPRRLHLDSQQNETPTHLQPQKRLFSLPYDGSAVRQHLGAFGSVAALGQKFETSILLLSS